MQAAKASHNQQQQQLPLPAPINQPDVWRAAFRAAPRELQQDLEISFVDQVTLN